MVSVYSDENGVVKTGVIRLEDNRLYYFNPEIYMTTPFSGEWAEFDGKLYHFEKRYQLVQSQKVLQLPLTLRLKKMEKPILLTKMA